VCHGPAYVFVIAKDDISPLYRALVGVVDASGKSIFAGKRFTGFSNAEEESVGKVKVYVPVCIRTDHLSCDVGNTFLA